MGVMNRLRDNTGVILWILVFAFGVIWVLQDSGGLDAVGNVGNNIGSVNGDVISVEEFNNAVNAQVQSYSNQAGESMPPQMLDQTRERVFNQLVESRLREQEMDRLGIAVSDQELVDMVQGADPHPIIKAYFSDGNDGVDRSLLQNFIDNPEAVQDWINIENYLRQERRREKLDNLVGATVRISDADVMEEHRRQNLTVNAEFVALRFAALPDDSISYSDRDLRNFYNQNKEEFARKKSYTFSYVSRSKSPTAADTAAVFRDVELLRDTFVETENDSLFLVRNGSERPWSSAYFRPDELDESISSVVFENPEPGTVVGPVIAGDEVHLIKVIDVRKPEEPAVKARHILFRAPEDDTKARAEALREANDVRRRIVGGERFEDLAREFGDDGTASRGGDLGWFGPGRMVAEFEEAAFNAPVGRLVGPVETQFGYHLIEVTDRAELEARIADFALGLRASAATLNAAQTELDDLQFFSAEEGSFEEEAERRGLAIQTVSVEEGQQFIPGLGNSRSLQLFLESGKPGDLSDVIELNNEFVVARLNDVTPEGYRDFEDVKSQLEPRLRNKLKAEIQVARLREALDAHGFDELGNAVNSPMRTAEGIGFSNMVIPGLGRDPKFVGTAIGLAEGEVSKVLSGEAAAYVIRVTAVNEPTPLTPAEIENMRERLIAQRRNQVRQQWVATLRESADIDDNRRLFLQ
ncbi:MAG: peptidylprolyl isomerase [Bacteroidetes bacterium CG12_big_fil_rev_8_21_14_0_65_60_17]|nr:MAG: peptidylprolyl isomerase [Bacteroidetes bacterium CG12_big_fil_rev_8_21_14_0_65_60_17]